MPVLGTVGDTRRLCNEWGADTVLVTRGGYGTAHDLRRIAWDLEGTSIDLVVVPSLTDVAGPRIHMRPVAGLPLLHLEQPQAGEAGGLSKRTFDVLFAGLRAAGPGSAARRRRRPRQGPGRRPGVLPAVTRRPRRASLRHAQVPLDGGRRRAAPGRAASTGTRATACCSRCRTDPRITPFGQVPAPLLGRRAPAAVQRAARRDEPRRPAAAAVRPRWTGTPTTYTAGCWCGRGSTGLWQVSGRSGLSWDESVRLDLYYVDNWSMTTDLVIIAKTVRAVLGSAGAY